MAVEECWVEPTMGYEPLHEVDAYYVALVREWSSKSSHETASCTYYVRTYTHTGYMYSNTPASAPASQPVSTCTT